MNAPRPLLIRNVNFLWYLAPIVPILALGYAALMSWLPSWSLLIAVFAFLMWLFSLGFTVFAVLKRKRQERKEQRP
ncbi:MULTISPECIES: hypothetical protein [Devosia]|jgi:membrane protein implicated in regulation of membrane protease activity|uniref:Uncharacterized protein n=1 Tax=Devosia litorisediminis TaxID=2829817 RepID=A0A942EI02_9HYPH|nr:MULTISPECIES: hypothetical protein [Devosia]MBS3850381.1 hypothetical protein [Devosia litorisediminis]MCZ4347423.1 hypothetical protein [Devosia neptuniae]|tara:strand:- start:1254 stop:1481 length:228 start_codon:yes stop_codon:yes gene_type:complete